MGVPTWFPPTEEDNDDDDEEEEEEEDEEEEEEEEEEEGSGASPASLPHSTSTASPLTLITVYACFR